MNRFKYNLVSNKFIKENPLFSDTFCYKNTHGVFHLA